MGVTKGGKVASTHRVTSWAATLAPCWTLPP